MFIRPSSISAIGVFVLIANFLSSCIAPAGVLLQTLPSTPTKATQWLVHDRAPISAIAYEATAVVEVVTTSTEGAVPTPTQTATETPIPEMPLAPEATLTTYTWWLVGWSDNRLVCSLSVTHAGLPSSQEIQTNCGVEVWFQMRDTQACLVGQGEELTTACQGLYLYLASTEDRPRPAPEPVAPLWDIIPPADLPLWLSEPPSADALASDQPLLYLAGQLISHGVVEVTDCPDGGLLTSGAANACGEERTRTAVYAWQDQFDPAIHEAAQQTHVPPYLLKSLFAQESQFWPATMITSIREHGLGHLTEMGADTLLLWNPAFYAEFCPPLLGYNACESGYPHLSAEQQALLRGAVVKLVRADCPTACPSGVDVEQAAYSVLVFAQTIQAYGDQVGQLIRNLTQIPPSEVSQYEDLWRFTVASYNIGPGCLGAALESTHENREPLDWEHVAPYLEGSCRGALDYVENISRVAATVAPAPSPSVKPLAAVQP